MDYAMQERKVMTTMARGAAAGTGKSAGARGEASRDEQLSGRYAIRHPWIGPIDCKEPRRGIWGGLWHDLKVTDSQTVAAEKLAFAPRGGVTLTSFLRTDVPELDVKAGSGPLPLAAVPSGSTATSSLATLLVARRRRG
jgi:hypothetical protein